MAGSVRKHLLGLLIPVHRYLGLALSLVLLLWFLSGIVMIFQGYPRYSQEERLAGLAGLQLERARVAPADAIERLDLSAPPEAVRINRLDGRPRMHLLTADGHWRSVYADTGEPIAALDRAAARARAAALGEAPAARVTRLGRPDQWTFTGRLDPFRPLWRVALDDAAGTWLYLSGRTGELVHRTTWSERAWAYAGPIIHWVYPTQLRRLSGVWRQLVMWLAGFATVACLSGLILGVLVLRSRHRPGRHGPRRKGASPYRGWGYWHHWLGLSFGVLAGTWAFSGLLSLNPFHWASSTRPTAGLEHVLAGAAASQPPRAAPAELIAGSGSTLPASVREVRWQAIGGVSYYRLLQASGDRALLAVADGAVHERIPTAVLRRAVDGLDGPERGGGFEIQAGYDRYYYPGRGDRVHGERPPLPVYRAEPGGGTRLYLDPASGEVVHVSRPDNRLNRWLYHGLHNLDFPFLAPGSGLWYSLIVALSLGGTAVAVTGVWLSVRYCRRKAGARRRRGRRSDSRSVTPTVTADARAEGARSR